MEIITQYTKPKFNTSDELQYYVMNIMGDHGTHIFMFDLQKQKGEKGEVVPELGFKNDDIILNPSIYEHDYPFNCMLETSLKTYLKFLYIEYPDYVKIFINGHEVDLANPYSILKKNHTTAFFGEKTDKFAV